MKIKSVVVLGLTTFGLMAFAGCGGDDSADTTAKTPPPEPTATQEFPAEAVVALDRLNASVDRLKLLAASVPDCGKEPQISPVAAACETPSRAARRRYRNHLSPQQETPIAATGRRDPEQVGRCG